MPLTPVQLVGGSYVSRARSLDLSSTINCTSSQAPTKSAARSSARPACAGG